MHAASLLASLGLALTAPMAHADTAPPMSAATAARIASASAQPIDAFALDSVSREIPATGRFTCPTAELIRYRGTALPLTSALRLQREFAPRVAAFEQIVIDIATRVYGRAPKRMQHLGGYVCRRMKTYPTLLSEHALGDAIDIAGFEFPAATRAQRTRAPKGLAGAFNVSVDKYWYRTRGTGAIHAQFLHDLASALVDRADLFRVILGPGYPGHDDHLHLDTSTYRLIVIDLP